MSSQRGNCAKSGAQKHQNTTAYRNDLHRKKDKTMKILNSLKITGCCKRCKEVIEWKIKYNKYKPLTRPKKCVKCLQKSVTNSYYIICQTCIETHNLCGKCASTPPTELSAESSDAVGSEINAKSSINAKGNAEDEDDRDSDEEGSDIDNAIEKVLTITDEAEVSIKPNRMENMENQKGAQSKGRDMSKASDKSKVTFEDSESEEHDSEDEQKASDGDDENEDSENASCVDDKKYDDKQKLDEGNDKTLMVEID